MISPKRKAFIVLVLTTAFSGIHFQGIRHGARPDLGKFDFLLYIICLIVISVCIFILKAPPKK